VTGDSRRRHNEQLHEMCYSLKHYSVDQIKNEVGDASGTHEGKERCIQGFSGETKRKEITCKIYAQITMIRIIFSRGTLLDGDC